MGKSLIRRLASLLFVLAFVASAQAHALSATSMPMPAKTEVGIMSSMLGMAPGSPAGDCKDCGKAGASMSSDCAAICAPVYAIGESFSEPQPAAESITWTWVSDAESTRSTAPDPTPPRS